MWIGGWWRADTLRSPDIDVDYASDRRQEIKANISNSGTMSGAPSGYSLPARSRHWAKAVLKDVARVHRLPHSLVNYITAIFDDNMDWTGLFKLGGCEQEGEPVRAGLPAGDRGYPHADGPAPRRLDPRLGHHRDAGQPGRPAGECFDFLPIRKMDGLLVSEFDGYSVDEIGLLKEDVLATKELSKLSAVIGIVNRTYG